MTDSNAPSGPTPYEQFGGHEFFVRLVHAFYVRVAVDPVMRPMYPDRDLGPAEDRLRLFLEQYWGGPTTYSDERGHPRLRMRHADFAIDAVAREHWLAHMHDALLEQGLPQEDAVTLWNYFVGAAHAMQNIPDELPPGATPVAQSKAPSAAGCEHLKR